MAVPAGCRIASFRAHELNLCPSTSPTHPGSGHQILPGMLPLLRREGRCPQAGQGRKEQRTGRGACRGKPAPTTRARRRHAQAPDPRPCGSGDLAFFVHGVLLDIRLAASSAWRHAGGVRVGPRPLYVRCCPNLRRPRCGGGAKPFAGEEESNLCVSPRPMS